MKTAASDQPVVSESSPLQPGAIRQWLAGSATVAGSLAAAGSASGEVVQITLSGNEISASGTVLTDNTNDDVTGDGIGDLGSSSSFYFRAAGSAGIRGRIAGQVVRASFSSSTFSGYFNVRVGTSSSSGGSPESLRNFIPIRFTDARINGGATTEGYLEVFAENLSESDHRIELVRLIFDDADTDLPSAGLRDSFPEWIDLSATSMPLATAGGAGKIERKIAALERKIRQIKANSPQNAPRLNFYKLQAARLRQIAIYERQIAALKRKLVKGGR